MAAVKSNNAQKAGKRNILSILFLVVFGISLYVLTNKAVVPFVEGVANSDAFLVDDSALGDKDRTDLAILQCNEFIQDDFGDRTIKFVHDDLKKWELSRGHYLIASTVVASDSDGNQVKSNYACNVRYTGGDDSNHKNWSLEGLDLKQVGD